MPRDAPWTFDEVEELCRRAFTEGCDFRARLPLDPTEGWEVSEVAGELAEMCT